MANALTQQPLFLDTDQSVAYKSEPAVLAQNPKPLGVFVENIVISVPGGTAPTPGSIVVTDGDASGSINLLVLDISATTALPFSIAYTTPLQWRNFKITGLTATGTSIQIWTR
jgi:hypothetical protein